MPLCAESCRSFIYRSADPCLVYSFWGENLFYFSSLVGFECGMFFALLDLNYLWFTVQQENVGLIEVD